jgi:hypothetical protein
MNVTIRIPAFKECLDFVSHIVSTIAEKSDYEHIRRLLTPHLASCVTRHGPLHVTGALRDTEALRVTARYG